MLHISVRCISSVNFTNQTFIIKHTPVVQHGESEKLQTSSYVYTFLKHRVTHNSVANMLEYTIIFANHIAKTFYVNL